MLENNMALWVYACVCVLGGELGINKQTLTSAAVENQPGEHQGLRPGAGSSVWHGDLPSTDPELQRIGAAWLH